MVINKFGNKVDSFSLGIYITPAVQAKSSSPALQ